MRVAMANSALGLLLAAALWTAAHAAGPGEWQGITATARELQTVVARHEVAWAMLWRRTGRDAPVKFDPAANIAVGVFLGARPTGGFAVEIVSVEERGGDVTVAWREIRPGRGAIVTQAFTSPWAIRLLPRTDRRVVFRQAER